MSFLKEATSGVSVAELCRRHGFSSPSYYLWKRKYGRNVSSGSAKGSAGSLLKKAPSLAKTRRQIEKFVETFESLVTSIRSIHDLLQSEGLSRGGKAKPKSARKAAGRTAAKRKAGSGRKRVSATGRKRGRKSRHAGKMLVPVVKSNPRRKGSMSWKNFKLYGKEGISYENYRDKGGKSHDLERDIKDKYVQVK